MTSIEILNDFINHGSGTSPSIFYYQLARACSKCIKYARVNNNNNPFLFMSKTKKTSITNSKKEKYNSRLSTVAGINKIDITSKLNTMGLTYKKLIDYLKHFLANENLNNARYLLYLK